MMSRLRPIRLLLALLLLAPISYIGAQERAAVANAQLEPGDVVRVAVWRHPEFSGDFVIGPDGTITHPLYREIRVVGQPWSEVENRVRTFLSQYEQSPAVVMTALQRVFVGGEVRQPNAYPMPPGTTVAQAIALAGGPTDQADLKKVVVWRDGRQLVFDLSEPSTEAFRIPIQSADQIGVARARSTMRDVIAPLASISSVILGVTSIIVQLRR